jgi:hypothetical protein
MRNFRNDDFNLVGEVLVPCFTVVQSWLPDSTRMADTGLETS